AANAAASTIPSVLPRSSARSISLSIVSRKTHPSPPNATSQITAPPVVQREKRHTLTRRRPASAGATVSKPGTNFANSSDGRPRRTGSPAVGETHESGSRARRQRKPRAALPHRRPSAYQTRSAPRLPRTPPSSASHGFSAPIPAIAPSPSSTGAVGIGSPSWSRKTTTKTTAGPCRATKSNVDCTGPSRPSPAGGRPLSSPLEQEELVLDVGAVEVGRDPLRVVLGEPPRAHRPLGDQERDEPALEEEARLEVRLHHAQ